MNRLFSTNSSLEIIRNIRNLHVPAVYEHEKHRMVILDETGNEIMYFRLPLLLPPPDKQAVHDIPGINYIIILIQAGNCALGYFERGINVNHKVFRAYMVRKKQGVSQIKYLKTKGKSRAGSRVRLGETVEFFEMINERLQTYFEEYQVHRIAISCSKTLLPYMFSSKVATPFDKRDPRLYKIPKHIHTPIYEVMMDANKFLQKGELIWEETYQTLADALMGVSQVQEDEEEDLE